MIKTPLFDTITEEINTLQKTNALGDGNALENFTANLQQLVPVTCTQKYAYYHQYYSKIGVVSHSIDRFELLHVQKDEYVDNVSFIHMRNLQINILDLMNNRGILLSACTSDEDPENPAYVTCATYNLDDQRLDTARKKMIDTYTNR